MLQTTSSTLQTTWQQASESTALGHIFHFSLTGSQSFEKVGRAQNINVIHVKHVYVNVTVSNGRTN